MAIKIRERPNQQVKAHYSNSTSTREYSVTECPTRDVALTMVQGVIPAFDYVGGTTGLQLFFDHIDLKEHGGGNWTAIVHYGRNQNTTEMDFDIGRRTFKATTSKLTVSSYDCSGDLPGNVGRGQRGVDFPDFEKGIGWDGKKFDGVDIEAAELEFTVQKRYEATTLTPAYLVKLYDLSQTVNDHDYTFNWEGQELLFGKGCLRFRGARVKRDADGNLSMSYSFVYSKGIYLEDNFTIGDSDPIEKEGHEYMWVLYEDATNAGRRIKRPVAVYIEKVYDYGDFTELRIN